MSGAGAAVAPRMAHASLKTPNWDPTHGCEPAVQAERAAAIDHIRRKIAAAQAVRGTATAGNGSQGDIDHLVRVLDELAEDLARGLHLA